MKVGNLSYYRFCGCLEVFFGPNPCCGTLGALVLLTLFSSLFTLMSSAISSDRARLVAHIGVAIEILIYLSLCLSGPGVPPSILRA